MSLEFSKYHGLSNDFLLVYEQEVDSELAKAMCQRYTSVGADGVIVIRRSAVADFAFRLFNADGGVAEVSGNGLRCVGKFLYEKGLHSSSTITIEAAGDVKVLELEIEKDVVVGVRADMGLAKDEGQVELQGRTWKLINTGNPHAVTLVDDIEKSPVTQLGPLIENDPMFPDRTNVEFIQVIGDVVHARFWERGVGETMASGTGSCASLVASGLKQGVVRTLGGDLSIELDPTGRLFMSGPAVHVFDGRLP